MDEEEGEKKEKEMGDEPFYPHISSPSLGLFFQIKKNSSTMCSCYINKDVYWKHIVTLFGLNVHTFTLKGIAPHKKYRLLY